MKRTIFHIDVNSAYLSWESVRRQNAKEKEPDLRTIAAVIGGDETKRHGIVLAKSPLAKQYGIQTGEPLAQARKKCPNLVIVPPDFSVYVKMSNQFMDILRRYAPVVEQYSIDEAFCDMSGTETLYGDLVSFAHTLKNRIFEELGFTVNIGVSSNKLLAKMASDFEKPDKVHTLFPEEIETKIWPMPVGELFFVGPSTTKKLHSFGIRTIGDLANANKAFICSHFKKHGETIWKYANGFDSSPVKQLEPANKCYGNSITLPFDVTDKDTAKTILLSLCETVAARLRADQAYISVVSVTITDSDFHTSSRQATLPAATNITERIYDEACSLFDLSWPHTPIRLLGVSTSHATDHAYAQANLFDTEKYEKFSKLNHAIDSIRDRYGEDSIKRACFVDSKHAHMAEGMSKAKRGNVL